jgi:tetratricopeptide (TPR) repeat protein
MPDYQALTEQFQAAYRKGKYKEAAEICGLIAAGYEGSGELISAAEMKNNRSVALLKSGQAQAALAAAEGTDEIFAAGGDMRRQAIALGNQAAAFEALGQMEKAANCYRESAGLLEKTGDKEMHAIVMKSLSTIYMKQGKQIDTVIALQASLENDKHLSPRERTIKKILNRLLSFLR